MLSGIILTVQLLYDAVGGVDRQSLCRPGVCGAGGIEHISQTPPLVHQLVDHDLPGAGSLAAVLKIGGGEIRLV